MHEVISGRWSSLTWQFNLIPDASCKLSTGFTSLQMLWGLPPRVIDFSACFSVTDPSVASALPFCGCVASFRPPEIDQLHQRHLCDYLTSFHHLGQSRRCCVEPSTVRRTFRTRGLILPQYRSKDYSSLTCPR